MQLPTAEPYPQTARARDDWIVSRRPPRNAVNPREPYAVLAEPERSADGEVVQVATIFLTNRECPWRCAMCDLWKNTLAQPVPSGAIPAQIDAALAKLPPCRHVKLYNSGSFFDRNAIPPEDHDAIAQRVRPFDRVIVECHPALVGDACLRFRDRLAGQLEIAMGLETVHSEALERLNKRMTADAFARAAAFLRDHGVALRSFVLVGAPFIPPAESLSWTKRSIDFAFDCGSSVVALIPTRFGNGAMEGLAAQGEFHPPALADLEAATAYGVSLGRGRVFADLWDLGQFSRCKACLPPRRDRLEQINLSQTIPPPVTCTACRGPAA